MRSIHAFTILVPSYDAGLSFYVDTLGFVLKTDQDQGNGKRWVMVAPALDGPSIILAKATTTPQVASIGQQTGDRVGFFLGTTDFDRDYAEMKEKGVFFEETPRSEPYGKVAVWQDPFGNRWDLLEVL